MEKKELTTQERERYDIIRACIDGDLTNAEAASRLGLKIRQVQNLKCAVGDKGNQGIVHGNKGKVSNNVTDEKTITVIETFLKEEKHHDFGPTFAMEQLVKQKRHRTRS